MACFNNEIIEFPVSIVINPRNKLDNKELLKKAESVPDTFLIDIIQAHMAELPLTPVVFQWVKTNKETVMSFLTKYEVIIAFRKYRKNKFPILINNKQKYFDQLSDDEVSKFWFTGIRCLCLKDTINVPNFIYYMEKF